MFCENRPGNETRAKQRKKWIALIQDKQGKEENAFRAETDVEMFSIADAWKDSVSLTVSYATGDSECTYGSEQLLYSVL